MGPHPTPYQGVYEIGCGSIHALRPFRFDSQIHLLFSKGKEMLCVLCKLLTLVNLKRRIGRCTHSAQSQTSKRVIHSVKCKVLSSFQQQQAVNFGGDGRKGVAGRWSSNLEFVNFHHKDRKKCSIAAYYSKTTFMQSMQEENTIHK